MNTHLPILLAFLLTSCTGVAPCVDVCEATQPFREACMAEDGTMCGGSVIADCVDDVETWEACKEDGFSSPDCDWMYLEEQGVVHACESPGEATSYCKSVARQRFRAMSDEEREEEIQECEAFPVSGDALDEAIVNEDCEAFCAYFGV